MFCIRRPLRDLTRTNSKIEAVNKFDFQSKLTPKSKLTPTKAQIQKTSIINVFLTFK